MLLKFSKKLQLKNFIAIPTIKVLDDLCRAIVRIRDKWTCRRCGRSKAQGWKVEWAHFIGRGNKAVRWDLDNSCMLCFDCHYKFMHGHDGKDYGEDAQADFWRGIIGGPAFDALKLRACGKAPDRRLVKIYLDCEMAKLEKGIQ